MNRSIVLRQWLLVGVIAAVAPLAAPGTASAHGPDPRLGGALWAQDQAVAFQWRAGQVPPSWMATAIEAGAADASASRGARAATFSRTSSAASLVAYGEPTGCSPAGIACMDRSGAPSSFRVWFRAHGYRFDWGTLRWCQAPGSLVDGCFDVEAITLDELGHVEVLDHHVNFSNESDYGDAVVQAVSHARPKAGWNAHVFGRCDIARLQLEYDLRSWSDPISRCVSVPTVTTLTSDVTTIGSGWTIHFSASLKAASDSTLKALSADPLSSRAVTLQRRSPGATTWTTLGSMSPSTAAGTYVAAFSATSTYDYRAVFAPSSADGALGSSSGIVTVTVACTAAPVRSAPLAPCV